MALPAIEVIQVPDELTEVEKLIRDVNDRGIMRAAMASKVDTALRMFLIKVKQVRGLPFEVVLPTNHMTRNEALNVLARARQELSDFPEMSIEEIDAEIHESRRERKGRTS